MTLKVGDRVPSCMVGTMTADGPDVKSTDDVFKGKKVALFGLPGAFTKTCSSLHMPGFIYNAEKFREKGVDTIACMSVNDAFVMGAWGKDQNADELLMLADGNAELTKALGLEMDGSGFGMGTRCKRMAMIVDDGVVSHFAIEPPGGIVETAADKILSLL